MKSEKSLFDDDTAHDASTGRSEHRAQKIRREVPPLDRLRSLEEKITAAVERVKALKEEKILLEKKIKDLEMMLNEKNQEIELLRTEKSSIGHQLEELLHELDSLEM
jgi:chromosome segregation ATPase